MLKQGNHKGFTIIEVVITIAIGAAVMALVLNAVQGARRSQRNTNRTADVSAVTAAVNQYIAARNELPAATTEIESYLNELAHYDTTNIEVGTMAITAATPVSPLVLNTTYVSGTHVGTNGALALKVADDDNADEIVVLGEAECDEDDLLIDGTNTVAGLLGDGGIRQMVITYRLEADTNIYCEEI